MKEAFAMLLYAYRAVRLALLQLRLRRLIAKTEDLLKAL